MVRQTCNGRPTPHNTLVSHTRWVRPEGIELAHVWERVMDTLCRTSADARVPLTDMWLAFTLFAKCNRGAYDTGVATRHTAHECARLGGCAVCLRLCVRPRADAVGLLPSTACRSEGAHVRARARGRRVGYTRMRTSHRGDSDSDRASLVARLHYPIPSFPPVPVQPVATQRTQEYTGARSCARRCTGAVASSKLCAVPHATCNRSPRSERPDACAPAYCARRAHERRKGVAGMVQPLPTPPPRQRDAVPRWTLYCLARPCRCC